MAAARVLDWWYEAACRGHHELFHPQHGETATRREEREAAAVAICRTCPVMESCDKYADTIADLDRAEAVYAAKTPRERGSDKRYQQRERRRARR